MIQRLALTYFAILCMTPQSTSFAAEQAKPLSPAHLEFFETKVRPILVQYCYKCHSSDSKKIKGDLLLDSKAGWVKGGETGPAIVPGSPEKSLFVTAINFKDEFIEMPPKGKMPQDKVDTLIKWIKMGAPDPRTGAVVEKAHVEIDIEKGKQFWSFLPIQEQRAPKVKNTNWPESNIDHFILDKLENAGLLPPPDASRRILIRRAYYTAIGLPPTPKQITDFENDPAPNAFAKVVDELLASPRYGERWGRHWLDIARYAETSGGGRSVPFKNAFRYRDYVIRSFNNDKPYDQFMKEQIAGDLLPHTSNEQHADQLTGTGYLMIGPINYELQDKELLRMEVIDEQLHSMGKTFLGLTIGCARCHDHKFDPIPTADYYALAGIFRSTKSLITANVSKFIEQPLPAGGKLKQNLAAHSASVKTLQTKISSAKSELNKHQQQLAKLTGKPIKKSVKPIAITGKAVKRETLPGIVIDNAQAKISGQWTDSTHTAKFVDTGYIHTTSDKQGKVTFEVALPNDGEYEVRVSYSAGTNRTSQAKFTVNHADGNTTRTVNQRLTPPIDALFTSLGKFNFSNKKAVITLDAAKTPGIIIVDAVQLIDASATIAGSQKPVNPPSTKAVAKPSTKSPPTATSKGASQLKRKTTSKQVTLVQRKISQANSILKQLNAQLAVLNKTKPPQPPKVMCVIDEKKTGDYHICVRGNAHKLGAKVPRGFLQVASSSSLPARADIPDGASGRLQLANWLAHSDNPLPARVMSNRIWKHVFGQGIVRSTDNLGTTGESPSHVQLLNQLSYNFVQDGWSVKKAVRKLMLSRTFRMSHHASNKNANESKALHADPENRLLHHFPRKRLEGEAIRDAMLMVSGQLKENDKTTNRSVFLPIHRNNIPDMLDVFDFANPNLVTGKRPTSTIPTQALFLMNSPFVQEQAKAAAERLLAQTQDSSWTDTTRIKLGYNSSLGRDPSESELRITLDHINKIAPSNEKNTAKRKLSGYTAFFHGLFASMDFRYAN